MVTEWYKSRLLLLQDSEELLWAGKENGAIHLPPRFPLVELPFKLLQEISPGTHYQLL
jgi:hypothetical protein